jgi:uncharacterized protein (TIGR03905 family)
MFEYATQGTCSSKIHFDIKGGKVYSVSFENGCDGNLKALSRLVEGMDSSALIDKLKGIHCGHKGTSCADQLAKAVESFQ